MTERGTVTGVGAASAEAAIAELGMYPMASVRWAWDALWAAVAGRATWAPPVLAHSGDVHARWDDPQCVVNHVCGWPLAARHAGEHRVVGAFSLTIPEADGFRYRSTLVTTDASLDLRQLAQAAPRAAVNSTDSLSGWISLLAASACAQWPGELIVTGAHVHSLRALQDGTADVACIDSWTLRLVERERPELLDGIRRIALGPPIPTPAITARRGVPERDAQLLGEAFAAVLADPASSDVRQALLIDGFVPLTIDHYLPVLDLVRNPRESAG